MHFIEDNGGLHRLQLVGSVAGDMEAQIARISGGAPAWENSRTKTMKVLPMSCASKARTSPEA